MADWTKISTYPGAELVLPGLREAAAGQLTTGSCLVSIARPVIEASGLTKTFPSLTYVLEPEHALYRLLQKEPGDTYGRYNSLLRRLVSFERALRREQSRASTAPGEVLRRDAAS